jgi:hypothetical protein
MKKWLPDLQWHKECLQNIRATLAYREQELARMQKDVERLREDVKFYSRQIDEAELAGKTTFDRDRFLKSKRANYAL